MRSVAACVSVLGFAVVVAAHGTVNADAYPEQPLTIVEPWAPGSAGDVPARILAELAQEDFGQPIVVQNLTGGGGARAALFTKNADPDGYTVMNGWVANVVMAPIFNPDVGYARSDFEPIVLYQVNPFTLVVSADHPAQNLDEFVTWAKDQPETLNVSVCAATGLPRLVMERFLEVAGITDYEPVPYQDCETDNIKALFDGTVDFATGALSVPKIYGDRVRTLALFLDERSPIAPDIPTAKEQGYDLEWGLIAAGWSGLFAPKGVPQERLDKLTDVFSTAVQSEAFAERCAEIGITVNYLPPDELADLVEASHRQLGPVIKELVSATQKAN